MMGQLKKKKGFTLVELIMVMSVIAVLVSVLYVATKPQKRIGETNDARRKNDAQSIEQAIKVAATDDGESSSALKALTEDTAYAIVKPGGSTSGTYSCTALGTSLDKVDISSSLLNYLPVMPIDPDLASDNNETGYYIIRRGSSYDVEPCNTYRLAATTGSKQMCGDGYCGSTESCSSCPQDCGVCVQANRSPVVSNAGRYPTNGSSQTVTTISWDAWTDPDNDVVEYYTQLWKQTTVCTPTLELENTGWSTARSYDIVGPIYLAWNYSWKTKARSQGESDETEYNTCYSWLNDNPKSSCPFLYLWDGQQYEYLTDVKGQNIGFPATHSRSKKTKYYLPNQVPLNDFASENDVYTLKFRESLKEMNYFDEVKMLLVDHPTGYDLISSTAEDRLTFQYQEQESKFYTIKDPRLPIKATDQDGHDVLQQVSFVDNILAQDYGNPNSYVELDFGQIDPAYSKLVIDGWSIYQLAREKREQIMPYVEVLDEGGDWQKVKDFGFVSGDLKTMVVDLSNKFLTNDYRMRLHFGYNVVSATLLDRIRIDDSEPVPLNIHEVSLNSAELYHAGMDIYDYANENHRVQDVRDISEPDIKPFYFYGNFTKYGDVKELLSKSDDMFVIFRHGDALDITFKDIEQLESGQERTPVLYADIFYKIFYEDKSGQYGQAEDQLSIYPLPFKGMTQYPYDTAVENYPNTKEHQDYLNVWNTRVCEEGKDYCLDSSSGLRILTSQQKRELDIAASRILNGVPKEASADGLFKGDIANVKYAQDFYGYIYENIEN